MGACATLHQEILFAEVVGNVMYQMYNVVVASLESLFAVPLHALLRGALHSITCID